MQFTYGLGSSMISSGLKEEVLYSKASKFSFVKVICLAFSASEVMKFRIIVQ